MNSFVWDECYLTGESIIDAQHQELVALVNALGERVMSGEAVDAHPVRSALDRLAHYASFHFADEEALAEAMGVDRRETLEHRQEHAAFVQEVTSLQEQVSGGSTEACDRLMDFLIHWLGQHILEQDHALMRQVHAIRGGASAAVAFEEELERRRTARSADPLIRALSGLFHLLSRRNAELAVANRTLEQRVGERTAELAAANARLEALVRTDALTELPNRRHALAGLELMWREGGLDLGLLLLDVDGFKGVNDTYGHDVGDLVLRRVSRALRIAVRTDDLVGRLGGDEFVVLLPHTALPGALQVATGLREAVARERITTRGHELTIHISVGAAVRDSMMRVSGELLKQADEALYVAKRAGRDCVATVEGAIRVAAPA